MSDSAAAPNPNHDELESLLLEHNVHMISLHDGNAVRVKKVSSINQSRRTVWIVAQSGRRRSREIPLDDIAEVHVD